MWGIIIDVVLIAIIVICAIIGIVKGLFDSILGLIGTGIALGVAVFTAKYLSNTLNSIINIEQWVLDKLDASGESVKFFGGKIEYSNVEVAKFAVWIITVIVIFLVIKLAILILSKIFESVVQNSPTVSGINRVLGMIFGALKGGVTVAIILALCSLLSQVPFIGSTITDKIGETKVTNTVYKYVDDFVETQLTKEKIDDIIDRIVTENQTPEDAPVSGETQE
jgi:uncharacterized membrane protein required for colicin V production